MKRLMLQTMMLAGVVAFILSISQPFALAANTIEIILKGGPHAGMYTLSAQNIACMSMKSRKQFSAAYKDPQARDAKSVSGAGINVFNPDDAGARRGEINIRFGDPDEKHPAAYGTAISRDSTGFSFTKKGAGVEMAFDGQTKNGMKLHMSAICTDIDQF